jgi:hypothetical protein
LPVYEGAKGDVPGVPRRVSMAGGPVFTLTIDA